MMNRELFYRLADELEGVMFAPSDFRKRICGLSGAGNRRYPMIHHFRKNLRQQKECLRYDEFHHL